MGRAPCCDKANVKRGPWSPEEDAILKGYIESHGTGGNWITLPQKAGLKRCGKSCRLRWLNYLRPDIKLGGFTEEEDNVICSLYFSIGSRWSVIASNLPGRTDNDVKNYWNTRLKKKLLAGRTPTGDTDVANVNPNPSTSGKIGVSGNRFSSSFPKPSTSTVPHLPHPSSSRPNFFSPASSLPSLTEVSDNTGSVASANMDFQVSSSQEFSSSFGSSSSITEESYSRLSIDNLLDLDFGVMYDILSSGFGFEQVTGNRTSVVSPL